MQFLLYIKTVRIWKGEVEQNEIRNEFACLLNRFLCIGSFASNEKATVCFPPQANPLSKGIKVIYNKQPNSVVHRHQTIVKEEIADRTDWMNVR